jgi:hypothetical protein
MLNSVLGLLTAVALNQCLKADEKIREPIAMGETVLLLAHYRVKGLPSSQWRPYEVTGIHADPNGGMLELREWTHLSRTGNQVVDPDGTPDYGKIDSVPVSEVRRTVPCWISPDGDPFFPGDHKQINTGGRGRSRKLGTAVLVFEGGYGLFFSSPKDVEGFKQKGVAIFEDHYPRHQIRTIRD